jgi:predicted dinucleotide-binding enzyme
MGMLKSIAIIGATGELGTVLAEKMSATRAYRLLLMDNDTQKLESLQKEISNITPDADMECISCSKEASWEADLIVMAVADDSAKEVVEKIREVSTGKTVISISGIVHEKGKVNNGISAGMGAAELQLLLPNSKVVKALHWAFDHEPAIEEKIIDTFITGFDREALQNASQLLQQAGFNPATKRIVDRKVA